MADIFKVDVAYALPDVQKVVSVEVTETTTVQEAVVLSKLSDYFPEIIPEKAKVGVFNRAVKLKDTLRAGDRIEIYRPLIADPKTARVRRAAKAKEEGRADKVTGGRVNSRKAAREST